MRHTVVGALALLALPAARALDEARPPGTPAEQYKALAAEYQKSMDDFMKAYQEAKPEQRDKLQRELQHWVDSSKKRIEKNQAAKEWPELPPATNVPPLEGRARFERMVRVVGGVLLPVIFFAAFFVVHRIAIHQ